MRAMLKRNDNCRTVGRALARQRSRAEARPTAYTLPLSLQSRMGLPAPSLTRSRRSLPGLKCGTYLPDSATVSPVFGLRPWRGGRKCSEKLPKPRISMRPPWASASLMISRICLTASSTSLAGRCFCFAAMSSMSSDFVMLGPVVLFRKNWRLQVVSACSRAFRLVVPAPDVLFQQVAETRAARGFPGAVVLHGFGFLVDLLRLDRQRDRAALAIHVGELRLDLVADLQHRARVLDAVTRQLGGAQMALDAAAQVDDRALGVDFAHRALDDRVLRMLGDPGRERILRQLLDTQRNALALRIDRQHHRLDLLGLLVVAHGFFAGHVPGDVRQVHEAVDAAREADEDAEVGDRLDLAGDLVAAVEVVAELLPRVRLALLDAQRDAAALLVDVEHHHLDFLADVHDFRRIHVLVGPVHLGPVHQAFDAFFDLDEAAVVGNVRDLAEQARAGRIAAADLLPRVVAELLDAQRHALALAIELEDAHVDLVADVDHFRRMLDALPRHVGDVQQAVDAAEVDERAVVGEVLDRALDDRAFLQLLEQLGALGAVFLLHDRAVREHDVVALLGE